MVQHGFQELLLHISDRCCILLDSLALLEQTDDLFPTFTARLITPLVSYIPPILVFLSPNVLSVYLRLVRSDSDSSRNARASSSVRCVSVPPSCLMENPRVWNLNNKTRLLMITQNLKSNVIFMKVPTKVVYLLVLFKVLEQIKVSTACNLI